MVKEYWHRSACLTPIYLLLAETKSCFSQEKGAHYRLALISKLPIGFVKIEIDGVKQCLKDKCGDIMVNLLDRYRK